MKSRRIRTRAQRVRSDIAFRLGGWFQGRDTYMWFGDQQGGIAIVEGPPLYRLAKAIVRQFEVEKKS